MSNITEFTKKHDYLVCVDSDGCAMDTMDIKHYRCFGPCMVDEWGLNEWRDAILERWNEVNLYTMTRGINRFKGLALALAEINEKYRPIEDVEDIVLWAESSPELSNGALQKAIDKKPESRSLPKALAWSIAVNKAITELPECEVKPFPLAREALEFAHARADVAIVSSANLGAVMEEWEKHGLLPHTDIVMAQNSGSKAACIAALFKKGYDPENVLMCGDAPGDLDAARKNGVFFFPILVRHERESWQEFMDTAFDKLLSGGYGGEYHEAKKQAFVDNLSK
ncbi:MAG: HAD hydrolase-like protein [Clostridia bacterium]|nr:HAD hydrolase-like protein [Clostridia bacterium]